MLQKKFSEVSMAAQEFPVWEVSGAVKRSDVAGSALSYFVLCRVVFSIVPYPWIHVSKAAPS